MLESMDQETQVSPDAETLNPAAEPDATAEVVPAEPSTQAQPDAAKESEVDPRDKAVKQLSNRVHRITSQRYQAEARAEEAERKATELAQRLATFEQPTQEPTAPNPVEMAREIARIEKVNEQSNAVYKIGVERFKDFDDALNVLAREAGTMFDKQGRPTSLGDALLTADDPAAMIHRLGTDPDLAAELGELNHTALVRRIERLERDMVEQARLKKSSAPAPLEPVRGQGGAKDPSDMSDAEFNAWRKRQVAQRR